MTQNRSRQISYKWSLAPRHTPWNARLWWKPTGPTAWVNQHHYTRTAQSQIGSQTMCLRPHVESHMQEKCTYVTSTCSTASVCNASGNPKTSEACDTTKVKTTRCGAAKRSRQDARPKMPPRDQSDLSHENASGRETAFIYMQAIATKIAIAGCQAARKVARTAQPGYRAQDAWCCSLFYDCATVLVTGQKDCNHLHASRCDQGRVCWMSSSKKMVMTARPRCQAQDARLLSVDPSAMRRPMRTMAGRQH